MCEGAHCSGCYTNHMRSEQYPADRAERLESYFIPDDRIDRENGVLKRVRVMGLSSAHGYDYDPAAIASNRSRFEGMLVGLDHDYNLGPITIDKAWGVLKSVDESSQWADLHFNRAHTRTEQLLEMIERGIGPLALSPVTKGCVEENRNGRRVVTRFEAARIDLVVGGATTKTMFEQAPPAMTAADIAKAFEQSPLFAGLVKDVADLKARSAITAEPQHRMEQEIKRLTTPDAARNFDPKKFWDASLAGS